MSGQRDGQGKKNLKKERGRGSGLGKGGKIDGSDRYISRY